MIHSNTSRQRPHILFLSLDQWGGPFFGFEGHPVIRTPTLDQLARLGTRFSRAYSESPICIPARRSMMTGQSPRGHGDRSFLPSLAMPRDHLLAQCMKAGGYQTVAIGKLHVFPQRDRIGFDQTLLAEEGRPGLGAVDDYDLYLSDQGHTGEQFMHGMSNNGYEHRTWHLKEAHHVTHWITRTACREIKRRDPMMPGFWHVSYTHPHPPLVPLASYEALYELSSVDLPLHSEWSSGGVEGLPTALQVVRDYWPAKWSAAEHRSLRRAYYALCTHIDHQIRILIGTLREEGLLDDTVILLTSDHGDMLGDHGLWAKRLFYENSARVPMILVGARRGPAIKAGHVDSRLVGLQDLMPTLLDIADLPIPSSVEGLSMLGHPTRTVLYGECGEGRNATRMLHNGRYKLIWYPGGQRVQLFDLETDPQECVDLSQSQAHSGQLRELESQLIQELYGEDLKWVQDGRLVGFPWDGTRIAPDRQLSGQRGLHYPQPPVDHPDRAAIKPA
jgi:arylsulfatase